MVRSLRGLVCFFLLFQEIGDLFHHLRHHLDDPVHRGGGRWIDREQLDEIVDLMLETVCTSRKTIRVAGDDYPAELVKSKYMKLNGEHIRFVLDGLRENTTRVRNIKQYLRAMLFNAPSTISNYYTALVAHDMAQPDWGKSKSGLPDGSCGGDESL